MRSSLSKFLFLAGAGLISGILNGLLGAGGGIIAVFALSRVLSAQKGDSRDAFANTLCITLPLSLVSAALYSANGALPQGKLNLLVFPAIAGGLAGGFLLDKIDSRWLRLIFSAIVIWSGISMVL